jgi:hypothetical protein
MGNFDARTKAVEMDTVRGSLLDAVESVRGKERDFFPWLSRKSTLVRNTMP